MSILAAAPRDPLGVRRSGISGSRMTMLVNQVANRPSKVRPVAERRRGRRFSRCGRLMIFLCQAGGLGDGVRAQFRDASTVGIGLDLPEALPPGEQFLV